MVGAATAAVAAVAAAAEEEEEEEEGGGREFWETEREEDTGAETDLADCRSARGDRPTTEGAAAGRWGAVAFSMFAGTPRKVGTCQRSGIECSVMLGRKKVFSMGMSR